VKNRTFNYCWDDTFLASVQLDGGVVELVVWNTPYLLVFLSIPDSITDQFPVHAKSMMSVVFHDLFYASVLYSYCSVYVPFAIPRQTWSSSLSPSMISNH